MQITGNIILITGGGSGIGRGLSRPPAKVRSQSTEPMIIGRFNQSFMISK